MSLPRGLPATTAPAVDVLAGTADVAIRELTCRSSPALLHLSAGVVRTMVRPPTVRTRRGCSAPPGPPAAASRSSSTSRSRTARPDLPAGVHWYDPPTTPSSRSGRRRGDAPVIVVTGVPWRTGWRYRERGYRHVYWDAGTMLAQLLAAADSAGSRRRFHPLPGRGGHRARRRGRRARVARRCRRARRRRARARRDRARRRRDVDAAPLEFPLVTPRSGRVTATRWRAVDRGAPVEFRCWEYPLETVVLARG